MQNNARFVCAITDLLVQSLHYFNH